jgi:hypothetical protein
MKKFLCMTMLMLATLTHTLFNQRTRTDSK